MNRWPRTFLHRAAWSPQSRTNVPVPASGSPIPFPPSATVRYGSPQLADWLRSNESRSRR